MHLAKLSRRRTSGAKALSGGLNEEKLQLKHIKSLLHYKQSDPDEINLQILINTTKSTDERQIRLSVIKEHVTYRCMS